MHKDEKLFALAAVYDKPDNIIAAAKKISGSGYTKYDVNTPYPLHGMDGAMKLKPSKLGFVTLVFGLTGTTLALLLTWFTMSKDYPMIIGGKPFFALPAFIPVAFELTVLFATLATVFGMIAFFFNLPFNNHPIHDTMYMEGVSGDKFGIYVETSDKKFNREELEKIFNSAGAIRIEEIYLPVKETYPIFQPKFIIFLLLVAAFVSTGTYLALNKLVYMVPFNWMMEQVKTTPQERSEFYTDGFGMRNPVEGTIARGFIPYTKSDTLQIESIKDSTKNPLPMTDEVLLKGQKKYLTYCSPCHGDIGNGDQRLRGLLPVMPPALHTERAKNFSDAQLYHIITVGRNNGNMPGYSHQISREERWAIINYVRVLQRAKNATENDIIISKQEPK